MIVQTSGLGNTLTDIATDVSAQEYANVPADVISGIFSGDGWAYILVGGLVWLGYRMFDKGSQVKQKVQASSKSRQAKRRRIEEAQKELADLRK